MSTLEKQDTVEHMDDPKGTVQEPGSPVQDDEWHRTSRRIVRKLDMTLMPMIWLMYLCNYLDRNSIA